MPRPRALLAVAGILVLLVTACTDDVPAEPDPTPSATGEDAAGPRPSSDEPQLTAGVLQEFWLLSRVEAVMLDGATIDLLEPLVELVAGQAEDPVELGAGATFAPASGFGTRLVGPDGSDVDTADVVGGLVTTADGDRAVAIVATPEPGEWLIGRNYTLRFDLPASPRVPEATPIIADYGYAQFLPVEGATGVDGTAPLELLGARAKLGAVASLSNEAGDSLTVVNEVGQTYSSVADATPGTDPDADAAPAAPMVGEPVLGSVTDEVEDTVKDEVYGKLAEEMAREAAEQAGVPADAEPLIQGLNEAALEALQGCRDPTCMDDVFDEILEGAEDSWKNIEDKLDYEDDGDGPRPDEDDDGGDGGQMPPPDDGFPDAPPVNGGGDSGGGDSGGGGAGGGGAGGGGAGGGGAGDDGGDDDGGGGGAGDDGGDDDGGGGGGGAGDDGGGGGAGDDGGGDDGGDDGGGAGDDGGDDNGGGKPNGRAHNDPHMRTFDGVSYRFNEIGEFVIATSDDLEVQARFIPNGYRSGCDCVPSMIGALAISDGTTTVFADARDQRLLQVDGEAHDLYEERMVEAGDLVIRQSARGVDVIDANGTEVRVIVKARRLELALRLADGTQWTGLLGSNDDDRNNEFADRDGEVIGTRIPPRDEGMYGPFADAWRLDPAASVMVYRPGETSEGFGDMPPEILEQRADVERTEAIQELRTAQAEIVCSLAGVTDPQLLDDCIHDFSVTGEADFVQGIRAVQLEDNAYDRVSGDGASDSDSVALPDQRLAENDRELATGDGLVLVRTRDPDGRVVLHAIDTATTEVRWSTVGVSAGCRPVVVEDVGVVVEAQRGSDLLGDDRAALVLLSLDDGTELARFSETDDVRLERCSTALVAADGVVVHAVRTVHAFDVTPTGLTARWTHDPGGRVTHHTPVVDGHVLVSVRGDDGVSTRLQAVALDTGSVASTAEVAGRKGNLTVLGDGLVGIATSRGNDTPAHVSVLEATNGQLATRWSRAFPADAGLRAPPRVARLGDVVAGWSDPDGSPGVLGVDLDTGEDVWGHEATSFHNNDGLVVSTGDAVVVAPFGGAWLEAIDGEGQVVETREPPPEHGQVAHLSHLTDGRFVAAGSIEGGGAYVEFVDGF